MGRVAGGIQASEVVYEADVIEVNKLIMTYYGQTKRHSKEHWREHKHTINNIIVLMAQHLANIFRN